MRGYMLELGYQNRGTASATPRTDQGGHPLRRGVAHYGMEVK